MGLLLVVSSTVSEMFGPVFDLLFASKRKACYAGYKTESIRTQVLKARV